MDKILIRSIKNDELRLDISSKDHILNYIDSIFRVKSQYILPPKRLEYDETKTLIVFEKMKHFSELKREEITKEMLKNMPFEIIQACYDYYMCCGRFCVIKDHIFYNERDKKFMLLPLTFISDSSFSEYDSLEKYVSTQIFNIYIDLNLFISPETLAESGINIMKKIETSGKLPSKQINKILFLTPDNSYQIPSIFIDYQNENCEFVFLLLELYLRCLVENENFINKKIEYQIHDLAKLVKNVTQTNPENKHIKKYLDILSIIGFDIKTSLYYRFDMDELAQIYIQKLSVMDYEKYFMQNFTQDVKFRENSLLNSYPKMVFKVFLENIFDVV